MTQYFPTPERPEDDPERTIAENPIPGGAGEAEPIPEPSPIPADEWATVIEPTPVTPEPEPAYIPPAPEPTFGEAEPSYVASEPAAAPAPEPGPSYVPPAATPPPAYQQPLSPEDERTWAMMAHLSILINLVTGFLGPVAALIIYLVYKDRSRFVAYHSMQSFVFQMITWVGAGILAGIAWTISGVLAAILIGCLLMPIALLISLVPLAALVYGVIAGIQVNSGQNFKYWLVGDWVRGMLA